VAPVSASRGLAAATPNGERETERGEGRDGARRRTHTRARRRIDWRAATASIWLRRHRSDSLNVDTAGGDEGLERGRNGIQEKVQLPVELLVGSQKRARPGKGERERVAATVWCAGGG